MSFEVKYTKTYSDEEIADIISLALEGGIGYWACLCNDTPEWKELRTDNSTYEEIALKLLLSGKCVEFESATPDENIEDLDGRTGEPDSHWRLTKEKLENGLSLYLLNGGKVDIENMDVLDGDAIIQYSIFGEVIFG